MKSILTLMYVMIIANCAVSQDDVPLGHYFVDHKDVQMYVIPDAQRRGQVCNKLTRAFADKKLSEVAAIIKAEMSHHEKFMLECSFANSNMPYALLDKNGQKLLGIEKQQRVDVDSIIEGSMSKASDDFLCDVNSCSSKMILLSKHKDSVLASFNDTLKSVVLTFNETQNQKWEKYIKPSPNHQEQY